MNERQKVSDSLAVGLTKPIKENVGLRGHIEITQRRTGKVISRFEIHNIITNNGKDQVAKRIVGVTATDFQHIGIGTGTTAATAIDSTLQAEITTGGGARALGTASFVNPAKGKVEKTFTFTASFAVTEAGLFDSISGGVMLARQTFLVVNVSSGDTLTISWIITAS